MRKIGKRLVAMVLALAMGLLAGTGNDVCKVLAQNEQMTYWGEDQMTEAVYEAENFKVRYTLLNLWNGGFNANVEIENTGEFAINNWHLFFPSTNEFVTVWNGEIAWHEEGQYVVKNAGWNQDIAPGQKASFGIGCNENFSGFPESYELLGRNLLVSEENYSVDYRTESIWEGGFSGSLTITNQGEEVLEDWSLSFFCEQEIVNLWNARIVEKDGKRYLLDNAGYNGNIAPGQTITIGFTGTKGAEEIVPGEYRLFSCRMSEFEEEGAVDETKDSDSDGVPDYMEDYFGTDISKADTDCDGLSDFIELMVLKLDPLSKDSDSNGVKDGEEDADGDGCANLLEMTYGTDLVKADTDSDRITDYDEITVYKTDVLLYDTDGDGASDGLELEIGTDPKARDELFTITVDCDEKIDGNRQVTVEAVVVGALIETLTLEKVTEDIIFSDMMPGYLGNSYLFRAEGEPVRAKIFFELPEETPGEGISPTIYGFCDQRLVLEELDTVVQGTLASAEIGGYSTYILINKTEFEANTSTDSFVEDYVYREGKTPMFRAVRTVSDKDYDGQADSVDPAPLNNRFTGLLSTGYSTSSVDFTMDYRWFFKDNEVYNSDLSKVSVLLSSAVYQDASLSIKDSVNSKSTSGRTLDEVLNYLGMSDTRRIDLNKKYSDIHTSEVGLGYKTVSYNGQEKTIVAVVVRGTNGTIEEWSSNFEIGDSSKFSSTADWKTKDNHAGFDIAANRIMREISSYIAENGLGSSDTVYWITGHSRGAAIANIIGAYYEDSGKTAFTYTFATPNTTLALDATSYCTIFNLVNTDDLVPYMPMGAWGYSRYGRTANESIADSYEKEWEKFTDIFDYNPDTLGMQDVINKLGGIAKKDARVNCYKYTCKDHGDGSNNTITITNYGMSKKSRENAIAKIPTNALPYCKITRYNGGFISGWDFDVCQTPAYFMQILAAIMSEEISAYRFTVELNIADRYEKAKNAIISSYLGGVEHPHYPESYYILSKHITMSDF